MPDDARIFFKDKQNELKGPFTERQVQEWYRKGWFESRLPFYFPEDDQLSQVDKSEDFTLDALRSVNGFGCPFIRVRGGVKSEFERRKERREQRLSGIEKAVSAARAHCAAVLQLQQRVEGAERAMQDLMMAHSKKAVGGATTAAAEGDSPEEADQKLGDALAEWVVKALKVYGSGDFSVWTAEPKSELEEIEKSLCCTVEKGKNKEMQRKVLEERIVQRMKAEEFFCCEQCQELFFNPKQALVHLFSQDHMRKETAAVKSRGIGRIRELLDKTTQLHKRWAEEDEKAEAARLKKFGRIRMSDVNRLRPESDFVYKLCVKYGSVITASVTANDAFTGKKRYAVSTEMSMEVASRIAVQNTKGKVGKQAMDELHAHMGKAPATYCIFCDYQTGDGEGFYAHLCSIKHMKAVGKDRSRFDLLTLLVNVHRRDLA